MKNIFTGCYEVWDNLHCIPMITVYSCAGSTNEKGEVGASKLVQITGSQRSERGPGLRLCCICFIFLGSVIICRLYKLALSDPAQVTLQLTVSLSDLV